MGWLGNKWNNYRQSRHSSSEKSKAAREYAEKAKAAIEKGWGKVGSEATETKEMARNFYRLLDNKLNLSGRSDPPTEEEVRQALEQLKDVGRLSVFTTAVILPGGAVSLLGLEILARKYGINFTFIPSSFRKNAEWKYPDGRKHKTRSKLNRKGSGITDAEILGEND